MHLLAFMLISALVVPAAFAQDAEPRETQATKNKENKAPFKESAIASNKPSAKGVTVLLGLNKITARTKEIRIKTGGHAQFGDLWIRSVTCWNAPADQRPESAALLDIMERTPNEGDVRRFSGWMFASSPAISALEHPVYDIRVLKCENK